jgi:ribonuclease HI
LPDRFVLSSQDATVAQADAHWSLFALVRNKRQPPAMTVSAPHFLLYAEAAPAAAQNAEFEGSHAGRWRFVLRRPGGDTALEAADDEPEAGAERLELLAVVRGLEALESPSRVTLLSGSRHIRRGLDSGLSQWRENGWQWERYGRMTPVKNGDLWQRLDRLLAIHAIDCGPSGLNKADDLAAAPPPSVRQRTASRRGRKLRVDAPHGKKSEIRNANSETNSKVRKRNGSNRAGFGPLNFLAGSWFRISDFVLRAFAKGRSSTNKSRYRKLNHN